MLSSTGSAAIAVGGVARPLPGTRFGMECDARTSYEVQLCEGLLSPGSTALAEALGDRRTLLVTTPTVARLHGRALHAALAGSNLSTLVLDVREESKSMRMVEAVCAEALAHGLNRRGLLVSFGGGVCSDVVTLAASLIRRGIGHIRVPTTLIGQIDAGIGLKGAVNFAGKKSFVGCFHPPEQVLIDPVFLRSLPRRFVVSGLAEAIKMAIVRDAGAFALLERWSAELVASRFDSPGPEGREVLRRSIAAMLDELRQNPYEDRTWERLVDFGHTFSPAIEAALGFEIHHGEAVAIDIAFSTSIARTLGLIDEAVCDRILRLIRAASLPVFVPQLDLQLCATALAEACRHRGGAINLVVPAGIGRAVFVRRREDLPDAVLAAALARLSRGAGEQP